MADEFDVDSVASSQLSLAKLKKNRMHSVSSKTSKVGDMNLKSIGSNEGSTYSSIRPSLADKLRVGYFSMDRACQTEQSDIIELKETTNLMMSLVQEISLLKKNLNYTKLALQADYDAKVETRSVELYNRTNNRIAEIEELHKERVKVIRHSFRTQLADAICKISTDYHKYYAIKGEMQDKEHEQELYKMAELQEEQKQHQQAQQEMLEMMQLQMSHEELLEEEDEESPKPPSISSEVERHADEIRQLTDTISNLEDRIDEFAELLEQRDEEREKLENDCKLLVDKLTEEQKQTMELKKEIKEIKLEIEMEKKNGRMQLEKQKEELQQTMQKRVQQVKIEAEFEADKKISDVEIAAKNKEKAMLNQVKRHEELLAESSKQLRKSHADDNLERDLARLKDVDKTQGQEILRLQKELDKSNKTWEVKVGILQQTVHALKDEMFLRTSLRRQSAKLQHASITYTTDSPTAISAAFGPAKPPSASRKYQLPSIVQGPRVLSGFQENESDESPDFDVGRAGKTEAKRASAPLIENTPSAPSPTPRNLSQTQA